MRRWPDQSAEAVGRRLGFRSGLEGITAKLLDANGIEYQYESVTIKYEIPARTARYKPDFLLMRNGIIVETKGRFVTADRKKHKLIKSQFPDLVLRIVFTNPNIKIGKGSKTTYGMWCDQHGIVYAKSPMPLSWSTERLSKKQLRALQDATGVTLGKD